MMHKRRALLSLGTGCQPRTARGNNRDTLLDAVVAKVDYLRPRVGNPCSPEHSVVRARAAFTIIELLIVMAIIIVLAGLIIGTSGYVQKKGARSRAEAEIAAPIERLISFASNENGPRAVRRGGCSVSVVAGVGFEPTTFRL